MSWLLPKDKMLILLALTAFLKVTTARLSAPLSLALSLDNNPYLRGFLLAKLRVITSFPFYLRAKLAKMA